MKKLSDSAFDLQDLLLVLGVVALVGGIAAWSVPASAIVFGLLCFAAVLLMERAKQAAAQSAAEKGHVR